MSRLLAQLQQRYPQDRGMRQSALIAEFSTRIATTRSAAIPQDGVYYWLPKPSKAKPGAFTWELLPFYKKDYGAAILHYNVWPEALEMLAAWWGRSMGAFSRLREEYAGVPRGRIVKMRQGFGLAHGGDTPGGSLGLRKVIRAFRLQDVRVTEYVDEHERMIPGQPEAIADALQIKTGHRGYNPFEEEEVA